MPDTFDMENTPDIFPDIFIDYQKIMMTSVFANPVVIYEKSRRIGITWAVAALAVLVAGMGKSAGGMDVFYMGYNLEMAREFIVYCAFGRSVLIRQYRELRKVFLSMIRTQKNR